MQSDLTGRMKVLRNHADPVAQRDLLGRLESKLFSRGPSARVLLARYQLSEVLGAGGMGVVYAAYDPELDRQVAIKLMRAGEKVTKAGVRSNLLREARAVARLAHPNVVPVFDVGTYKAHELWGESPEPGRSEDEQTCLFVVMERVQGSTLDRWLAAKPRSLHRILDVFVQAGRGLAAAHEVGVVHRDFKPTNVLVGEDGRARVLDFGLARQLSEPELAENSIEGEPTLPDTSLTMMETGVAIGTPAYMAPEQHRGEHGDARSDQYSFCVALFEALTGRRPFRGRSIRELGHAKVKRPLPFRGGRKVPADLRRALRRGLSPRQDDRFASMAELLALLEHHTRPRRHLLAAAGASLGLGIGVSAMAFSTSSADECEVRAKSSIEAVWSDAVRHRLRRAFFGSETPYAAAAWRGVSDRVERFTGRWIESSTRVCDSRERGPLLAARQACLQTRYESLQALIELFSEGRPEVIASAVALVDELPRVSDCESVTHASADTARMRQSALAIARARALENVGKRQAALDVLERELAQQPDGAATSSARIQLAIAEVMLRAGMVDDAETRARSAWTRGEAAGDALLVNRSITTLAAVMRTRGRTKDAADLLEVVRARTQGSWTPLSLTARLRTEEGLLAWASRREPEAARLLGEAERLWLEVYGGPNGPQVNVATTLALARARDGDVRGAVMELERIREAELTRLGRDHPSLANVELDLASVLREGSRPDEAIVHAREAIRILEQSPDWGALHRADAYEEAAVMELMLGHAVQAHDFGRRLVALTTASLGDGHLQLADAHAVVALADLMRGRPLASLASLESAERSHDLAPESSVPVRAMLEALECDALRQVGDLEAALVAARSSVEHWEEALPQHQNVAHSHSMLAMVHAQRGETQQAQAELVVARERLERPDVPVMVRGQGFLVQAEVLMELGRLDDAAAVLEQAEAFLSVHPDSAPGEQVRVLFRQATVAAVQGRHERALRRAQAARDLVDRLKLETDSAAAALELLGMLAEDVDPEAARAISIRAADLWTRLDAEPSAREHYDQWIAKARDGVR